MLKSLRLLPLAIAAMLSVPAAMADTLLVSVNLGGAGTSSSLLGGVEDNQALASYLSNAVGSPVRVVGSQDLTTELQRVRTGYYAVLLAPSHVIGSALRYGYEPVARAPENNKTDFIVKASSGIKTFDQAKGKRLGMPSQDSLDTYLAKGEMNAMGVHPKTYFSKITYSRYQDSTLFSLDIEQSDLVAVDDRAAGKWLAQHPGTIIMSSHEVPGVSVAINGKLPQNQRDKIRAAILQLRADMPAGGFLNQLHTTALQSAAKADFQYVSTLGYFTPNVLPGATLVSADQVKDMMAKGVKLFDTRVEFEYKEGHIKDAVSVPYKENSSKEVDYDASLDAFDMSKLPPVKSTPVIFACNGPECWKSYKSAAQAIKVGYNKVYWFRGGFPEWKAHGYPVE